MANGIILSDQYKPMSYYFPIPKFKIVLQKIGIVDMIK
jgi:hypothetical protein